MKRKVAEKEQPTLNKNTTTQKRNNSGTDNHKKGELKQKIRQMKRIVADKIATLLKQKHNQTKRK